MCVCVCAVRVGYSFRMERSARGRAEVMHQAPALGGKNFLFEELSRGRRVWCGVQR